MSLQFTPADLQNEIRRLAEEKPDFVYKSPMFGSCFYVHDTFDGSTPGCIVGHALLNLGVAPEFFQSSLNGVGALTLFRHLNNESFNNSENRAIRLWVAKVQGKQDNGDPWGMAVASADAATEEAEA